MKRIIVLLLISICFISLFAEERNIELQEKAHHKRARSLSYIPTVTQDGNILYIYSDIRLENLQIIVTDLYSGAKTYYSNITVANSLPYTIILPNIETGYCSIELDINQKSYYGYFEVTQ